MRCKTCNGRDYIPAPPTNSWRLYFQRCGGHYAAYNVLVPCPACGGLEGRENREALRNRLEARKRAGTFPLRAAG